MTSHVNVASTNGLKEKKIQETQSNGSPQRYPYHNGVRRRDHNAASRGSDFSEYAEPMAGVLQSRSNQRHEDRRRIRRRLRQKAKINVKLYVQWAQFMHSDTKNHIVAMIGEFVGTFLFLFFAFAGTQVANVGAGETQNNTTTGAVTAFNPAVLFYISTCFGFSLMVNAWIFFRISGGLFNPAVTLALAILGDVSPFRVVLLFIAQLTGACFSAYIVSVLFPTPFNVATTLAANTSLAQGVFIEAICTGELVFTIIMLAKEKHRATFIAPVGIGLSLFIGELVAVYYTGGSMNPARSFGPAAVSHDFTNDHWIYWVGPLIGTLLAVSFYKLFKIMEYEMVNPGQDGDVENDPTQNPNHEIANIVDERQAEVEEIHAIEQEGGLDQLANGNSVEPSVLDQDGVIGMAIDGVRDGDHVSVSRKRSGERDLEAQWQGLNAANSPSAQHLEVLPEKLGTGVQNVAT